MMSIMHITVNIKKNVKIIIFIILFFSLLTIVKADKIDVKFNECVDGDTAWFILNKEKIKTRFLAIDTPESTNEVEPYGKEASEYTCEILKNAKKIQIEYDENSDKTDKYDRHLVWVFTDEELLQSLIIKNGFGEVDYLYGDYKYTSTLKQNELYAKVNKIGMWQEINYTPYIIIFLIIIVLIIFSKTIRKSIFKTIKSKLK